jgi:hypothetical protein
VIRATWVQTGEDFDIGPDVDEQSRELIARLHRQTSKTLRPGRALVECRCGDRDASVAHLRGPDGRVHGIYVALVKIGEGTAAETWTVAHFDGRGSHFIRVGKGHIHQRIQEEYCTAFDAAGYPVDTEQGFPREGRREVVCDVLVEGPIGLLDLEVQRYHQAIPVVKGRTTKIKKYGVQPIWSADRITGWNENNAVPNIRTNDLSEALSAIRPVRDEWRVVGGLVSVHAETCSPRYGTVCPTKGPGRWCGGRHPRREPKHLRVYEVAERLPAGDLVVVQLDPKLGTVIMSAADRALYVELGGRILSPTIPDLPARPAVIREAECAPLPPGFAERLAARQGEDRSAQPVYRRGPVSVYLCQRCGRPAFAMADGLCMRCRAALGMDARPQ